MHLCVDAKYNSETITCAASYSAAYA